MRREGDHPLVSETEARQGNRRLMNARVLVTSLLAIGLLFALIYLFFFNNPPPGGSPPL